MTEGGQERDAGADHRTRPRRRGAALDRAIYEAALAEIGETGYAGLTMERVAERARASKASLYRRWPGRAELALDAAYYVMPSYQQPPDTGSLRADALAVLRATAAQLNGPVGEVMRGLLSETLAGAGRGSAIRNYGRNNAVRLLRQIVQKAVSRGECAPGVITDRRLEAGPAIIRQHFVFSGAPIPDAVLVSVVDEVMLPLFGVEPEVDAT